MTNRMFYGLGMVWLSVDMERERLPWRWNCSYTVVTHVDSWRVPLQRV